MKERRKSKQPRLKLDKCEICGFDKKAAINKHHIIPQCDPRCTNDNHNLAILCHSCHDLVHAGELIIIGVYKTTGGRKLMWFKEGEEPPLERQFWLIKDNPMVLRSKTNS